EGGRKSSLVPIFVMFAILLVGIGAYIGYTRYGQTPAPVEPAIQTVALEFPADRSLGSLMATPTKNLAQGAWQPFSETAQGTITVTTAQALHLEMNDEAAKDLSVLATLDPRFIRSISLPLLPNDFTSIENLKHLTALTTL